MYFAIVSVDASPVEHTKYPDDQNNGEEIKSQATGDLGEIPMALQKMTNKTERSDICLSVGHGSRHARRSLVV